MDIPFSLKKKMPKYRRKRLKIMDLPLREASFHDIVKYAKFKYWL